MCEVCLQKSGVMGKMRLWSCGVRSKNKSRYHYQNPRSPDKIRALNVPVQDFN